jgi:hypothetical protein
LDSEIESDLKEAPYLFYPAPLTCVVHHPRLRLTSDANLIYPTTESDFLSSIRCILYSEMLRTVLARSLRCAFRPHSLRRGILTQAFSAGPTEVNNLDSSPTGNADTCQQPPLLEQTIPQHFAGIVRQYGDRNACVHSRTTSGVV